MNASFSSGHGLVNGKQISRHEATSGLISTPPMGSTPPLTQSTSGSNSNSFSSQSPPLPATPPSRYNQPNPSSQYRRYGDRSRARYPAELGRGGHTPLHRRGTSQTYEPFEDLLREAGYKETRVFTPEAERVASVAEEQSDSKGSAGKVGGVVGFLSGFIPGSRSSSLREERHYSPPQSPTPPPVSHRQLQRQKQDDDATPRPTRTHSNTSASFHHTHNNASYTSLGRSSNHLLPPPTPSHTTTYSPRPSRATAYLRHIASVPDLPEEVERSRSTPANDRGRNRGKSRDPDDDDDDFYSVYEGRTRGNGEGEEDPNVPPVPKTWLETVARAVLLGANGISSSSRVTTEPSYSRAASNPNSAKEITPALRQLRQTRSVISRSNSLADPARNVGGHGLARTRSARSVMSSRSGLSDRTNKSNWAITRSPLGVKSAESISSSKRPQLLSRLDGSSRSGASEGEIRMAKVVCRSAPASRAASPVRGTSMTGSIRYRKEQSAKEIQQSRRERGRKKQKGKSRMEHNVPSLTRTSVEGDSWSPHPLPNRPKNGHHGRSDYEGLQNKYTNGWSWDDNKMSPGVTSEGDRYGSYVFTSDEGSGSDRDSSSEHEVDLARMLRPKPERQQSNHSVSSMRSARHLRKLLLSPTSPDGSVPPVPPLPSDFASASSHNTGRVSMRKGAGLVASPTAYTADDQSRDSVARWLQEGSYADGNDRYGTKSAGGKRGSLPTGWTGAGE